MAKRKAPKQYEEEQLSQQDKLSINDQEQTYALGDEPVSVNSEEDETLRGRNIRPALYGNPDEEKYKDAPVDESDFGLPEDSFLLDRKIGEKDLKFQMKHQQKDFLGSNMRKKKDFVMMFDRGKSTNQAPKVDLAYNVENNLPFKKELMAQQLLRNMHSRQSREVAYANQILKELGVDKELIEEIKEDKKAHQNEELTEKLKEILPNI